MMNLSAVRAQARNFLGKFVKSEKGVTAIEYAIVAAGVAAVCVTIFDGTTGPVHNMLKGVFTKLQENISNIIP